MGVSSLPRENARDSTISPSSAGLLELAAIVPGPENPGEKLLTPMGSDAPEFDEHGDWNMDDFTTCPDL
jgi:hypothetical protein